MIVFGHFEDHAAVNLRCDECLGPTSSFEGLTAKEAGHKARDAGWRYTGDGPRCIGPCCREKAK